MTRSTSGTQSDIRLIEVRRASKLLPHGVNDVRKAFVDLDLDIHCGQRIALFSTNAYESRSLLECLTGIEQPDKGTVTHHASVSWPVGSNQAFNKNLSGYLNARFAAEIYSHPGRMQEDIRLIQELAAVDDHTFHEPLASWKGPMRKALALAVSLAFDFDVMAVGKVGGWNHRGVHPNAVRIREQFERRIQGRTLVVLASGQHELALDYCDVGLAILEGRLAYSGDPEVCLEMVSEEAGRLKYERRQRVKARIARMLDDSESDDEEFDQDELERSSGF